MARISATLTSGMVVQLFNGRHQWIADEPLAAGGADTGPNPYELLLGSLGACTCMTISWYCRQKGLPLESVTASYDFEHVHAADCEKCEDPKRGFIDRITSDIRITGNFDDAQKKRLAQVAVRCPVHKTLSQGIAFDDKVAVSRAGNQDTI